MALKAEHKRVSTVLLALVTALALAAIAVLKSAWVMPVAGLAVAASLTLGYFLGRRSEGQCDSPQSVCATLSERVVLERITAAILEDFGHCTAENFEVNMGRVLSRLGSFTGASRCYLYGWRESSPAADLVLTWIRPGAHDTSGPPSRIDPGQTGLEELFLDNQPTLVGNLEKDESLNLGSWTDLFGNNVRAMGAIPILKNGNLLWLLGFDSRNTHQWGPQESSLLLLVADLFATLRSKLEAERALREAMENLQASNRAKTDFLANMSHEIRTPMNCILGISDLLIEMEPTNRQLSYLNIINDSGISLLNLINEVLDLSKIEAGQLVLDNVETDLRRIAEETVSMIAFHVQEKGLEIVCRVDPGIPENVFLDPVRLRQILTNLLNNASKFTNQGYILLDIQLDSRNEDSVEIRFNIQDTGVGIPENKLEMIFEKFTQAEVSTTREYGGTGLGLAISQNLVDLMGGRITAVSEVGKGSTFSFSISARSTGSMPEYVLPYDTQGVLVVAELEPFSKALSELFQDLEIPFRILSTKDQALELIANQPADGPKSWSHVLIDSSLCPKDIPDFSGFLEKIPDRQRPRILLMTSLTDLHLDSKLSTRGFSGTLTKPVFIRKLADALDGKIEDVDQNTTARSGEAEPREPEGYAPVNQEKPTVTYQSSPSENIRILLVEDNVFNQQVALGMLQILGCEVEIANNGKEALERFEKSDFDLIFMDCQMPVMDGIEATKRIRQLPEPKNLVPIVAMTANVLRRDLEACIKAGMNDTMTKPISRQKIQDTLAQWTQVGTSV